MERRKVVGREVPLFGSHSLKWVEASLPDTGVSGLGLPPHAPPQDYASSSVFGIPPTYLIWRICKRRPRAVEILEFHATTEIPRVGLRILFPEQLFPFAYICQNEDKSAYGSAYLLYALCVSGTAYLLQLDHVSTYTPSYIFSSNEFLHFHIKGYPDFPSITAVAAAAGCLVVGRTDGSVSCVRLGGCDIDAPDFMHELRDEPSASRFWALISRRDFFGSVKDLVIRVIHGRKTVFVLHSCGTLRVWDFDQQVKLLSQDLNNPGCHMIRLWVGAVDNDTYEIRFAILCPEIGRVNMQKVRIYSMNCPSGGKYSVLEKSLSQCLCSFVPKGKLIDVILTSNMAWYLRVDEFGLVAHNLAILWQEVHYYTLQEAFIAEQLFQNSEHALDYLYHTIYSISSSSKEQMIGIISSIFLRRLLHPGVHNNSVFCSTFEVYGKHWTDNEFQALTVDELRREIRLLIEHENISRSPLSAFNNWKEFCSLYLDQWRKSNAPCSLLWDSYSGAIGVVRQNGVCLFRSLEDIERPIYGTFDFPEFGYDGSNDTLDREILFEVLCCSSKLKQHFGPSISPIFYESIVGALHESAEDTVPLLLKTLVCGYSSSAAALHEVESGARVQQMQLINHKSFRKFSASALVSLRALCIKSSGWDRVLNVIERYLELLAPQKPTEKLDSDMVFNPNTSVMVQTTSQVAGVMFESTLDILLFMSYLLDISAQVDMLPDNVFDVQVRLIPLIHETIVQWLIIHFLSTMPSESSSKVFSDVHSSQGLINLPNPKSLIYLAEHFSRWIIWGRPTEKTPVIYQIALSLLRHGQYNAVEVILMIADAHLRKKSRSIRCADGEWSILHHLQGCCLLAQTQSGMPEPSNSERIKEVIRCFFRASSGEGAADALQNLPFEDGLPHLGFSGCVSTAAWKLQYYQWAMQKFEQYNISHAACQFAHAALEQVDEVFLLNGDAPIVLGSVTSIKGRLWANVFKFSLDLEQYDEAYCAIVSNPDMETKYICLRRFVIVLFERGASKLLCSTHLPFVGLDDKLERELVWKASCSDISCRPNPYKLLYAFEMHRQNWRKAAAYIYSYSAQWKNETMLENYQNASLALVERLNGISACINCLHLLNPMQAWIDVPMDKSHLRNTPQSTKMARTMEESGRLHTQAHKRGSHISIEELEDEFVITSAECMLSLANVKWTSTGNERMLSDLVDLLVETNLHDMAFTVALKFWKDSGLKTELERIFSALALKCCPSKASSSMIGLPGLLSMPSKDEAPLIFGNQLKKPKCSPWELLQQYLEEYKTFHGRLPTIVAETLLCSNPHIELPLWLVHMFKGARRGSDRMTGQESDAAALFRLYVDYGRYPEATELLIEFIEAYASVRPSGVIHRKRPSSSWFPYTAIERLWCQLEESRRAGNMTEQFENLKVRMEGALHSHLLLLKGESKDAISFAI